MIHERSKSEIRKKQIVNAAGELIAKYGSGHMTLKAIAEEVGFSEAAIYRHFKTKRDILTALISAMENQLLAVLGDYSRNRQNMLDFLNEVTKNHLSFIRNNKGMYFQIIAQLVSLCDKDLNERVIRLIHRYVTYVEGILHKGAERGEIRGGLDLKAAALLFYCMINSLIDIWVLSNYEFNLKQRYLSLWEIYRMAIETGASSHLSSSSVNEKKSA